MMKYGMMMALAMLALSTMIVAECPNGCSGYGTCSAKDMCNCHKNFEGNDCSLQTCPFGNAHVDTPKGDLNMDMETKEEWALTNSQRHPSGIYETRSSEAQAEEGHFYMECSNQGLCDRETGDCTCFEPYQGSSCQRTVCPNSCSNHGSCESISELATGSNGKLFHTGRALASTTYDLWDAKMTYGCKCDPGFYGADCSLRRCKVGVDPMYEAIGTEVLETVSITLDYLFTEYSTLHAGSWIRLRFFDHWGEAYITDRIGLVHRIDHDTTSGDVAVSIAAALTALPNKVISEVNCHFQSPGTATLTTYVAPADDNQFVVGCQFTTNPGKLRLLEIAESTIFGATPPYDTHPILLAEYGLRVTPTTVSGENTDLCGLTAPVTVTAYNAANSAKSLTHSSKTNLNMFTAALTAVVLIKIKDQYMVATDTATDTTMTLAYDSKITITSAEPLYYSSKTGITMAGKITEFAIHSTTMTVNGDLSVTTGSETTAAKIGSVIFLENQFFTITKFTYDGSSIYTVEVDRPFYGKSISTGGGITGVTDAIYLWVDGFPTDNTFTYVSECSGRGLCDAESAVCQCFKGYTNDNCDTQNILAF